MLAEVHCTTYIVYESGLVHSNNYFAREAWSCPVSFSIINLLMWGLAMQHPQLDESGSRENIGVSKELPNSSTIGWGHLPWLLSMPRQCRGQERKEKKRRTQRSAEGLLLWHSSVWMVVSGWIIYCNPQRTDLSSFNEKSGIAEGILLSGLIIVVSVICVSCWTTGSMNTQWLRLLPSSCRALLEGVNRLGLLATVQTTV